MSVKGKCNNDSFCSIAQNETLVEIEKGSSFTCTECGAPLILASAGVATADVKKYKQFAFASTGAAIVLMGALAFTWTSGPGYKRAKDGVPTQVIIEKDTVIVEKVLDERDAALLQIEQLEEEKHQLDSLIRSADREIAQLKKEIRLYSRHSGRAKESRFNRLQSELSALEQERNSNVGRMYQLEVEIARLRKKVKKLESENSVLTEELEKERKTVTELKEVTDSVVKEKETMAAVLSRTQKIMAYNFEVQGLDEDKEPLKAKHNFKARKVDAVKIEFDLKTTDGSPVESVNDLVMTIVNSITNERVHGDPIMIQDIVNSEDLQHVEAILHPLDLGKGEFRVAITNRKGQVAGKHTFELH